MSQNSNEITATGLIKGSVNFTHGFTKLNNGIRLHYVETGNAKGLPIIFVHGFPDSWNSFRPVLEKLSPAFRAFAIDLRGFGESNRPENGYALDDFADDVVAFLDALSIEKASFVGHSMGSFVAQRVAQRYPERLEKLVLIGSASKVKGNAVIAEVLEAVNTLQDPIDPDFVSAFQAGTIYGQVNHEFFESVIQESLKAPALVWKKALKELSEYDHSRELSSIMHNTLIAWGDHDEIFSKAEQLVLFNTIPNALLKIYENAGHSLTWELAEILSKDIEAFIYS